MCKYFFFLFFLINFYVKAHPVIYKDGWVYWGQFSNLSNEQRISYTFHPRFSIEMHSKFYTKDSMYFRDYQLGLNALVKRWFFQNSQGNIYASLSGGFVNKDFTSSVILLEKHKKIFQSRVEMDWESRKLYTALAITVYFVEKEESVPKNIEKEESILKKGEDHIKLSNRVSFTLVDWPGRKRNSQIIKWSYRAGFAPYVAGMDELQIWMIFQLDYFKSMENHLRFTPLMRFFYKNVLWEIGSSLDGGFLINLMLHY